MRRILKVSDDAASKYYKAAKKRAITAQIQELAKKPTKDTNN